MRPCASARRPPPRLPGFVPHFAGSASILLAVGIVGATVMPHAIYLHSALTNGRVPARSERERRSILRFERLDVVVALGLAGLINMAMLAVAATLFHNPAGCRRSRRSSRPTRASPAWSAAAPPWPSPSPCWPRGSPRHRSAPTPVRS